MNTRNSVKRYQEIIIEDLTSQGKSIEEMLEIVKDLDITKDVILAVLYKIETERNKIKDELIKKMKFQGYSNQAIADELEITLSEFIKYQNKGIVKKESGSKGKKVRCIETGKVYNSVVEAQTKTGTRADSISHMIGGRQKSAGGYTWEYVE